MKVLRKGPRHPKYHVECPHCKSLLSFKEEDIRIEEEIRVSGPGSKLVWRRGRFRDVYPYGVFRNKLYNCPVCNSRNPAPVGIYELIHSRIVFLGYFENKEGAEREYARIRQ